MSETAALPRHARATGDPALSGDQAGFTLMEVITAIFIFFCGIMGVLSLFTTAVALHKTAKDRTVTSLAMEQVKSEVGTLLENEMVPRDEDGRFDSLAGRAVAGHPGYTYSVSFEETDDEGEDGAVLARISIVWKSRGQDVKETFETVFRAGKGMRQAVLKLRSDPSYDSR